MSTLIFDIPTATALERFCYLLGEMNRNLPLELDSFLRLDPALELDRDAQYRVAFLAVLLTAALNQARGDTSRAEPPLEDDELLARLLAEDEEFSLRDDEEPIGFVQLDALQPCELDTVAPPLRLIVRGKGVSLTPFSGELVHALTAIEAEREPPLERL